MTYLETGFQCVSVKPVFSRTVFVEYPEFGFVYHMFRLVLMSRHTVQLDSHAHKDFAWVLPADALQMNLIPDLATCLGLEYGSGL
jgi:hypothetical protein